MKKIFSKRFRAIFISAPLLAGGIALACADSYWFGPETSSFTPEAFVDSSYRPFFFTDMFYYDIGYDNEHNSRFNENNVKDWSGYLENKVSKTELAFLLEEATAASVDSVAAHFTGKIKQLPASLRHMKMLGSRNKKQDEFINYLRLAKQSEAFAVSSYDGWSYDEPKKPVAFNAQGLNKELERRFTSSADAFLKQRYWFQLLRSNFFNGAAQNAIELFETHKAKFPKNKLYYRAYAYAAGAYYKQKNYSKANYYYSRVYDECNELKTVAHYSFHPQEEADWKATLALAQNKNEQAAHWQMLGTFYTDENRAMEEIYKLDPKSEKLDLLLVRVVNKQEVQLGGWSGKPDADLPAANEVDWAVIANIRRIANAGNTAKPYMWHMGAGYLETISKNYKEADKHYAQAEKTLPKDKLPQFQLRLLKFMNKIISVNKITSRFENEVLPDMEWLMNFDSLPDPKFRTRDAISWVKNIMAEKYNKQQELVRAECFKIRPAFYGDNKNVEAMKSFLDKPSKNSYEQLCERLYQMEKEDLLEYQAIRLAFDDKINEAIT